MYGLTKEKTLKTITCYRYKGIGSAIMDLVSDDSRQEVPLKVFKRKLKSWRRAWVIGLTWGLENGHRHLNVRLEDETGEGMHCSYSFTEEEFIENYIKYVDKHEELV